MQNEIDDRRGRYREADDRGARREAYGEPADHYAPDEDTGHYADEHAPYEEQYQDFPPLDAGYEEEPAPRRSRLVPILAAVAAVLVVAIAIVGILYFIGVFDSRTGPATAIATNESDPIDLTPAPAPEIPDVRDVQALQPPADDPAPIDMAAAPDVRDAAVSIAPPAQGEPPVRSTHGDWQVRCDTPAGAQGEQCVLMQFVTAEDRDNVGLTVIVLKTADGQARLMRILAPLGVLLPSGLGLKIDETDIGRAGFVRCLPNGCVAEVILEEGLLDQLEGGETATFIIFQTPEEGIGIPISLAGFEPGFEALP